MNSTHVRILRIGAVLAALAVLASACGEDDPLAVSDENSCELQAADDLVVSTVDDHDEDAAVDDHEEDAVVDDHDDAVTSVDYVVEMDMLEFGYSCDLPTLDLGTVLEVRMTNIGAVRHEAVFGDLAAQNAAAAEMAEMAEMADASTAAGDDHGHGGDHGSPALSLAAGESGSIVVTMEEPGDMVVGCHEPGHWEAGMRSDHVVSA